MKTEKLYFFLCVLSLFQLNSCVVIISVPKSGTHLIEKAYSVISSQYNYSLELIKKSINPYQYNFPMQDLNKAINLKHNQFLGTHLHYTESYAQLFYRKKQKVLLNIRDPRDQVISNAYWRKKFPAEYPSDVAFSLNEIITDNIKNIDRLFFYPLLPWERYPFTLIIRFEDLVGEKGGGSYEKQLETIKKIAAHLNHPLTDTRAAEIADTLFGDTAGTFREGQIGSWKKHFSSEQKRLFKKKGGELLMKLGYEKDLNW